MERKESIHALVGALDRSRQNTESPFARSRRWRLSPLGNRDGAVSTFHNGGGGGGGVSPPGSPPQNPPSQNVPPLPPPPYQQQQPGPFVPPYRANVGGGFGPQETSPARDRPQSREVSRPLGMRNNHLHQVGTPPPASGEEASTPGIRTSHFYRGTPLPPVVGNIPGRVVQQQGNSSSSRPTATDPEHGDGAGGWDDESTILSSDDGGGATSAEHNHLPQQPPSQSGQQQGASTSTAAFSGGESGGGYSHEPLFASFRPESAESTDTSTADNVSGRGSYFRGSALGVDNLSFSGMRTPDTVSMGGRSSSHRGLSAHGGAKFGAGRTVVIPWYRNTKFWVWFVSILAAIHIILFWLVVGVVLSKSDLLFEGDSSVNTLSVTGSASFQQGVQISGSLSTSSLRVSGQDGTTLSLASEGVTTLSISSGTSGTPFSLFSSSPGVLSFGNSNAQYLDFLATFSTTSSASSPALPPSGSGSRVLLQSSTGNSTTVVADALRFNSHTVYLGRPDSTTTFVLQRSATTNNGGALNILGQTGGAGSSSATAGGSGRSGGELSIRSGSGGVGGSSTLSGTGGSGGSGATLTLQAGDGGKGGSGGTQSGRGGDGGNGGDLILSAGSAGAAGSGASGSGTPGVFGSVTASGLAFRVRPSSGFDSSEIHMGITDSLSKFFTIKATEAELAFFNPQNEKLFSFPATGSFRFNQALDIGAFLEVSSTDSDVGLTAKTSLSGAQSKLHLETSTSKALLLLEEASLTLSTEGSTPIILSPESAEEVRITTSLRVPSLFTTGDLKVEPSTHQIVLGGTSSSFTLTRPVVTNGNPATSTILAGQRANPSASGSPTVAGGDLELLGGLGTSTNGRVRVGTSNTNRVVLGAGAIPVDVAGVATMSQGLTVQGVLSLEENVLFDGTKEWRGSGNTMIVGEALASSTTFTIRRSDSIGDDQNLVIRAGQSAGTNHGSVTVGDSTGNKQVSILARDSVEIDSSGTVSIGRDASSGAVHIGFSGKTSIVEGMLSVATSVSVPEILTASGALLVRPGNNQIRLGTGGDSTDFVLQRVDYTNIGDNAKLTAIRGQSTSTNSRNGGDVEISAGAGGSGGTAGRILLGPSSSLTSAVIVSPPVTMSSTLTVSGTISSSTGNLQLSSAGQLVVTGAATTGPHVFKLNGSGGPGEGEVIITRPAPSSGASTVGGSLRIAASLGSGSASPGNVYVGSLTGDTLTHQAYLLGSDRVIIQSSTSGGVDIQTVSGGSVTIGTASVPLTVEGTATFSSAVTIASSTMLTTRRVESNALTNLELHSANGVIVLGSTTAAVTLGRPPVTGSVSTETLLVGQTTNTGTGGHLTLNAGSGASSAFGNVRIGHATTASIVLGSASPASQSISLQSASVVVGSSSVLHFLTGSRLTGELNALRLGSDDGSEFSLQRAGSSSGALRIHPAPTGILYLGSSSFGTNQIMMESLQLMELKAGGSGGVAVGASPTSYVIIGNAGATVTIRGTVSFEGTVSNQDIEIGDTLTVNEIDSSLSTLSILKSLSLGTTSNSYTIGRVSAGTSAGTDTSVNGQASTTNSGGLLLLNGGTGSTVGDVRIGTNPVSPEVRIGGSTTVIGLRGASTQISGQLEFVDAAQSSLAVVTAGSNILSLGQPTSSSFTVQRRPNNAGNGGELKILAGEGTVSGGNLEIKAGSAPTTAGSISIFGGDGSTRGSIVIGNSLASSPDALVELRATSVAIQTSSIINIGTTTTGSVVNINIGSGGTPGSSTTISGEISLAGVVTMGTAATVQGILTASGGLTASGITVNNNLQVSTIVTAAAADLRLRPSTHRLELGLAASDFTIGRPAQVVGSPGVATNIRGQNSDGAKGGSIVIDAGVASGSDDGDIVLGGTSAKSILIGRNSAGTSTTIRSPSVVVDSALTTSTLQVTSTSSLVGDVTMSGKLLHTTSTLNLGPTDNTAFLIKRTNSGGSGGDLRIEAGQGSTDGSIFVGTPALVTPQISLEAEEILLTSSTGLTVTTGTGVINLGSSVGAASAISIGHIGMTTTVGGSLSVLESTTVTGSLTVGGSFSASGGLTTDVITTTAGNNLQLNPTTSRINVAQGSSANFVIGRSNAAAAAGSLTIQGQTTSNVAHAGGVLSLQAGGHSGAGNHGDILLGTVSSRDITIGRAAGGTLTLNNPTISVPGSVSMTTGGASLSVAGSVSVQGSTTFSGVLIDADDIFTLRTQSGTVQPLTLTTLPAGSTLQLFPSGAGSLLLGQSGFGTTTLTAQAQTVQILSAQSMLVRATQELEIDSKDPTTGVQIATVSGGSVSGPVTISYAGQTTTIGGSLILEEEFTVRDAIVADGGDLVLESNNNKITWRGSASGTNFLLEPSPVASGNGGSLELRAQATSAAGGSGGDLVLSAGSGATAGAISVGTNAARTSEVTIGSATIPVTLQANPVTLDGTVIIAGANPTLRLGGGGTLLLLGDTADLTLRLNAVNRVLTLASRSTSGSDPSIALDGDGVSGGVIQYQAGRHVLVGAATTGNSLELEARASLLLTGDPGAGTPLLMRMDGASFAITMDASFLDLKTMGVSRLTVSDTSVDVSVRMNLSGDVFIPGLPPCVLPGPTANAGRLCKYDSGGISYVVLQP